MADPTVLQAKRYGVFSCHYKDRLLDAAKRMATEQISALVVVDDEGYLAGIITRTDLVRAYKASPHTWTEETVEHVMVKEVITALPQDHLSHVADLLLENKIHRVVIVQDENNLKRPVGVVSSTDLVYHMAKEHLG